MSDDLVFYTNPMSRGRIARWMLEEVGAAYRTEVLTYGQTMKGADYLALNPMGKVPAIVHKGKVVTETAAICAYLADSFPEARLGPTAEERADYYRWFFYAAGPVEAATTNKALQVVIPDERKGMVGYGSHAAVLDALSHALRGKAYFAGDRFTAVDVYAGSQIGWGMRFGGIEKRPEFEEYWARITAREAYARANAIDDALLPKP